MIHSLPLPSQLEMLHDAERAQLILDALSLAGESRSLRELVAQTASSLYRIFSPEFVAAFVREESVMPPIDGSAGARALSELMARLGDASRGLDAAVVVGRADSDDQGLLGFPRDLAHSIWQAPCVSAVEEVAGETVVFLLPFRQGASDEEVDAVESIVRRLIGEILARHERTYQRPERPPRLATLYTMLADIASQLDIDRLLETIVERARTLLGSDSAYLAEVDKDTRLVTMRVTTGIDDPGYKHASIEIGKGLAGATAALRKVMYSNDYVTDARFIHTPDTDANMLREGMRSALAAPLQVGDRVIGVLAVTNHRQTDFSDDDLLLIQSLADGAAIAIENARLYADQKKLVDELRELNTLTIRQHESLQRSVFIHDRLTELVLHDRGVDAIAERLSTLIANPVVVLGRLFNPIAVVGIGRGGAEQAAAGLERALAIPQLAPDRVRLTVERRPIHLAPDPVSGTERSLIVAPIMAGTDVLGFVMVIEGDNQFDVVEFQALEQAATVFALALTRERVIEEVENRLRGDFVNDLVAGAFDHEMIVRRATRLGHDLTLPQVVLAVVPDPPAVADRSVAPGQDTEATLRLERCLQTVLRRRGLMAQTTVKGDIVIALLALPRQATHDPSRRDEIVQGIQSDLVALMPIETVSIGVSRLCPAPPELPRGYREAVQTLRACQRLGLRHVATAFDRLGIERILAQVTDLHDLSDYADCVLGPLVAYDAAHGTDLLTTLHTYLRASRRQRDAADALCIHVNSLNYRLRRIEEIGNLSLDDAEVCLNLHVALRARQVLQASS